ncbi:cysteine synthase family protein [Candidatus Thorarchaeota archaeon]|nr:MAG: cysteine synthase family protein [Candidatus Thorarchaeota archaeon]
MDYKESMLEVIGNTPLLKLNRVGKDVPANVFVKLEHLNPSGSYKDRMALSMVEAAERGETWNGKKLEPGGTVCDASAGNTAPALAFVCAMKGYKIKLCTYAHFLHSDDKNMSARLKISSAFGANHYPCPLPCDEVLDAFETDKERRFAVILAGKHHMYEMERDNPDVIWVDQIYNDANWKAHMQMGEEIYTQLEGNIDAWGASVGSGATFLGVAEALKGHNLKPYTYGVVPDEGTSLVDISTDIMDSTTMGRPPLRMKICEMLGLEKWVTEDSIVEKMYKKGYPDEWFGVTQDDARNMANRLCKEEGIYCGMSSGANVHSALKVAETLDEGQNVVTVIVDRRDRYMDEYPNDKYVV